MVISVTLFFLLENEHEYTDRNLSLIVFLSALSVGHKIGLMFIITVTALAAFNHLNSHSLNMFGQYKKSISLYSIV